MILLDASVLVRYLRTSSPTIREVLASASCGICGVTRAEILYGARTVTDAANLRVAMDAFIQVPIEMDIWDHLGDHLASLRVKGFPTPFQDVLLATIAIHNNVEVWSYDTHFRTIQAAVPALRLFDGPLA
ncbi:MAG: PIN domain-containing protein [Burkholderiales bacterium]|nr:PIN domain-containing protein [Phycisphaerae bacterium]